MKKVFEIVIIYSILAITLLSFKLVFGLAGSLEELQSKVTTENNYRTELLTFINQSNVSLYNLEFSTEELEQIAEGIMKNCCVGTIIMDKIKPSEETLRCMVESDDYDDYDC